MASVAFVLDVLPPGLSFLGARLLLEVLPPSFVFQQNSTPTIHACRLPALLQKSQPSSLSFCIYSILFPFGWSSLEYFKKFVLLTPPMITHPACPPTLRVPPMYAFFAFFFSVSPLTILKVFPCPSPFRAGFFSLLLG